MGISLTADRSQMSKERLALEDKLQKVEKTAKQCVSEAADLAQGL